MTSSVFLPESVNEVVSFPPSTESILQAIAAIAWQSQPPVAMPAASWLQERGSLTARLRRQSGAFALHCLQEAVTADAGVRQVLLSVDGVAWIWGLTQIDAALLQPRQRLAAQRAALGGKALGAQRVAQRIGDGRFVVDDQDVHDGGNDKPCGRNGSRVVRTSARQWLVAKCSSDFNRWAFLRGKHAVP